MGLKIDWRVMWFLPLIILLAIILNSGFIQAVCGDGICTAGEDSISCPNDCAVVCTAVGNNTYVESRYSPTPNSRGDEVHINAAASDANGISSIRIYVDGTLRNTCNSNICSYSLPFSAGTHNYYVEATDALGNIGRDPSTGTKSFNMLSDDGAFPPEVQTVSVTLAGDTLSVSASGRQAASCGGTRDCFETTVVDYSVFNQAGTNIYSGNTRCYSLQNIGGCTVAGGLWFYSDSINVANWDASSYFVVFEASDAVGSGGTAYNLAPVLKCGTCGNNICESGEDSSNCPQDCQPAPICGNGVVETGEQCDDGNSNNNDACKNDCTNNICGDGVIYTGVEDCEGTNLSGQTCQSLNFTSGTLSCTSSCTFNASACTTTQPPVCGNSIIESGETCDDGNTDSGDGCSSTCQTEPPTCTLDSASWSTSQTDRGDNVILSIQGTDCDSEDVDFFIAEVDCAPLTTCDFGDIDSQDTGKLTTSWIRGSFSGNQASVSWIAEWIKDENNGLGDDDPEYVFKAELVNSPIIDQSGELKVNFVPPPTCGGIIICDDYTGQSSCNLDDCNVAEDSISNNQLIDCSDPDIDCFCSWDSTGNDCNADWNAIDTGTGSCGDGIINPGEQCDGGDWGAISSCSDFGLTNGNLDCNSNCQFDTSQCIGTPGVCGDNVINPGETCDASDWGLISSCSDFGLTDGSLNCNAVGTTDECQFDTLQCTGGAGVFKIGKCIYTEQTSDTCEDDGFLTFSWTASWTWDLECDATCQAANQDKAAQCKDGQKTVECPASIPLPFFGFYNIIVVLIMVSLIYMIMSTRKK